MTPRNSFRRGGRRRGIESVHAPPSHRSLDGDAAAAKPSADGASRGAAKPAAAGGAAGETALPRQRQSTADGRASTTCRAAARCSSISRKSPGGTNRCTSSRSAPCRIAPREPTSRRSGTIKIEADTQVALTERLVSFQNMKIVEAHFPTLQKEQVREITDRDRQRDARRRAHASRSIACWRISTRARSMPKNVEGVKSDPPDDLLQQDAGGHCRTSMANRSGVRLRKTI